MKQDWAQLIYANHHHSGDLSLSSVNAEKWLFIIYFSVSSGPIKPKTSTSSQWQRGPWQLWPLRFFVILFALLLAVMIWYLISVHDTSCHRSNTLTRSFHLALHYKGPPPT